MNYYKQYNRTVSKEFRELILRTYPGHGNDEFCWRLTQHLLFGPKTTTGTVLLPRNMVWALANDKSHRRGSSWWIDLYTRLTGIQVKTTDHNRWDSKCREAIADFDEAILHAWEWEMFTPTRDKNDRVHFVSGERVSVRSQRREMKQYDEVLINLARSIDTNPPAYNLMQYLLNDTYSDKVIRRNMDMAAEYAKRRYIGNKLAYINNILRHLEDYGGKIRYKPSDKTDRLFARGITALSLPRDVRKIIYSGCWDLDLAAAHLAISAHLWHLPKLHTLLSAGKSPWKDIAAWLEVDVEIAKPTLKVATYGICYGASKTTIESIIRDGDPRKIDSIPLGEEAVEAFFEHPIIEELMAGRARQQRIIHAQGRLLDAFGRWIGLPWSTDMQGKQRPNYGSIMSRVAQSHELKIMLQILPIIKANREIHCVAWQHDGCTVAFGDPSKAERWLRQMQEAITSYCRLESVPTRLEAEELSIRITQGYQQVIY